MLAEALWHIDEEGSEIRREEIIASPQSILVKARYSLISLGTESLVCRGLVPDNMYAAMRVNYMGGDFNFPIKYGYSIVGSIDGTSTVHAMHPHQNQFYLNESDAFEIPPSVSPRRATLLSNMETAVNAIWDAEIIVGQRILVIGFGTVGSLLSICLSRDHKDLEVLELDKVRSNQVLTCGLKPAQDPQKKYDVIFHTSAQSKGLQAAIDQADRHARIIELSWYGTNTVELSLGSNFHHNRLHLMSSQVSTISPKAPADVRTFRDRKEYALKELDNPVFDLLTRHEIPFSEAPGYFNHIRKSASSPEHIFNLITYE